ncbi:jasmonate-regulated gene 21 [Zea mays]|uniref:Jasmonate-regulated gene 21 n=1 Tax=Zea mays TaxID=4577 RepID=A0A1D6G8X1_MAIZE|nr:jasmonate-regulated gene 21 [Zea mays]
MMTRAIREPIIKSSTYRRKYFQFQMRSFLELL